MTCPSCTAASSNPISGVTHATCRACTVRELAKSPGFAASMASGKFRKDYAAALRGVAGESAEAREALHREVRAEDRRLRGVASR